MNNPRRDRTGKRFRFDLEEWIPFLVGSLVVGVGVLALRHLGIFQPAELMAYDQMVALQPDQGPDRRLLVVGISEGDIRAVNQWPFPDGVIAQLLAKLQADRPAVVGLDLYRDVQDGSLAGHTALVHQYANPNVYVITRIGYALPPPFFKAHPDRVGSNDVVVDPDGVLRRNLLFPSLSSPQQAPQFYPYSQDGVFYSFSLRLALAYLAHQGVFPTPNPADPEELKLGPTVFVPLPPNAGGYENIDNHGYQVILHYRSATHPAREVSLEEVLKNQVPPAWIEGKIVLVGVVGPTGNDLLLTPYSRFLNARARMPGVLIHAQSVSQILDAAAGQPALWNFWPQGWVIAWILFWTLGGGCLGWWCRHPLIVGGGGLVLVTGELVIGLLLFSHQVWVPVIAPSVGAMSLGAVLVTIRAYQAQQRQQMVMSLLGQNASPEVAQALWKGRNFLLKAGKLPGQRLTATVMFTDIRGFSAISETTAPESLLEWLNEYLDMITQVVQTHAGIVNKFTGDGVMAVFGVPVSHPDETGIAADAVNAVRCALTIRQRLAQLNQTWNDQGRFTVQMRVGIYTGPLVVGSLGGRERLEYGVIGDSVNIASRLESCLKERQVDPCRILIAEETAAYLTDTFLLEAWGPLELKGKSQTVEVFRVLGLA